MKKWIGIILVTMVLLSGCQSETPAETTSVEPSVENEVTASRDANAAEVEEGVRTFEEVMGMDIKDLSPDQIKILRDEYAKIEAFEFKEDGSNEEEYFSLYEAFDMKMIEFGLDVPYYGYDEVADKYKSIIDSKAYAKIIRLNDRYVELLEDFVDYEDPKYVKLVGEIEKTFDENGLPGKEITTQVENRSVQYVIYDVKNGTISFSDDSMEPKSNLTKEEQELYNRLWLHIKKIVPKDYMDILVKYEVNTDGIDKVMAHVVEETEDYSKWRLAIDLKDAVNSDGSFSDEFTNTVIHEFAHVMTLHKGELQGESITDENAYNTMEGYLKTDSYLNKFYQRFWKSIAKDHEEAIEEDEANASYDSIDAFYLKYEDQFVSDYAATNPAEDIAETYRVFVIEDKPTGNTIRDQKVRFMYEFKELVKIRTDIREALKMSK